MGLVQFDKLEQFGADSRSKLDFGLEAIAQSCHTAVHETFFNYLHLRFIECKISEIQLGIQN